MTVEAMMATKRLFDTGFIMLNGQTVLVVEEEFLIALDLQRMLEAHAAGQMLFARTAGEAHELEAHWASLRLALVEIPPNAPDAVELVRSLRDLHIAVVLNTADSALRRGHPDFPGVLVVVKPVAEDELAAAVSQALSMAKTSDCGS